jgi:hypothetical protein
MTETRCATMTEFFEAITSQIGKHGIEGISWYNRPRELTFGFQSVEGRWIFSLSILRGHYSDTKTLRTELPGGAVVVSSMPSNEVVVARYRADLNRALQEGKAWHRRLN